MNITELKNKIQNNDFETIFLVLQHTDLSSEYISNQYIKAIAYNNNLELKYISGYDDIEDNSLIENNVLYIMKVDKADKIECHDNLIIICNKTDYKSAVKIPKLEHWQFIEYLKAKAPGMNKHDIEWLITQYEVTDSRVTTTNYFRLENDIDKVAIFDEELQDKVFNDLYNSGEYDTISNLTVFDLTNALMHKDANGVLQVLRVFDWIDSKPHIWLLSILLNNVRRLLGIQVGINQTPESLGISDKQFYAIKKNNVGHYTNEQLINIYEMLTNIENKFKFGGLTQEQLADYIICKILAE